LYYFMNKPDSNRSHRRAFFAILVMAMLSMPSLAEAQFVIVTNAKSPIDSLSMQELQKVFKGQAIGPQKDTPLQIIEYDPACDRFYGILYDQNAYAIAKHWLRLIFAGERVKPPKNFTEIAPFLEFLSENRYTIGFLTTKTFLEIKSKIPTFSGNKNIRAVMIDGWNYGDAQYPLKPSKRKK
ncbi:MAG: hypothetical protein ACE5I1_19510, partial [bacterium]